MAAELPVEQSPQTTQKALKKPGTKSLAFLIVAAFLNTIGMTMVMPIVPYMTLQHLRDPGQLPLVVSWLIAVYGLSAMLVGPGLGLLSDRFGRRPVLLFSLLGSAIGYLFFGLGGALWLLFLGRIIDGLTAGDFSVLFAYVADITEPEDRGRYFGLMGGVTGAGFIIGPAAGGLLATFGYSVPFLVAAVVILLNMLWGYFFLPESLSKEKRIQHIKLADLNPLKQIGILFTAADLRWVLVATFCYYLPFGLIQATLTILLHDKLGWGATLAGLASTVIGVVDIFTQGLLVGWLLKRMGAIRLSVIALLLVATSYLLLGLTGLLASLPIIITGGVLFAGAGGLVENSLREMTSRLAGPQRQGLVTGAGGSLNALAMVLGPLGGGLLYSQFGPAAAYWLGGCVVLLAIGAVALVAPYVRKAS